MDSHQHAALLRMFQARRLMPWIPEHAIFIAGEIAKLEILDPHDAENFRSFYSKTLEDYRTANTPEVQEEPVVEAKEEPKEVTEVPKAEVVEEPKVEKKKKKKLI